MSLILIISALAFLVVCLAIVATYLLNKQKLLNREIGKYPAFRLNGPAEDKSYGTGPLSDLEYNFKSHIVSEEEGQQLLNYYEVIYSEAKMMEAKLYNTAAKLDTRILLK
jgi:hypothetical protein